MIKFGIDGIYDVRVMKKLSTLNLRTLVFDCDPRSPQFVQGYVIVDIIKSLNVFDGKIVLKFDKEKSFIINALIENLLKETAVAKNQLEVWINHDNEWVKDPAVTFRIHYSSFIREKEFVKHQLFNGFNFSAQEFEKDSHKQGEQKVLIILQLLNGRSFDHVLTLAPFDSMPTALCDFLEIKEFVLKINSDIEVCYRNVDFDKLMHSFNLLKRNSNLSIL